MARRKNQSSTFPPAIIPLPAETIRVGIDWADGKHEYLMMDPQGMLHRGDFEQSPEAITTLMDSWQRDLPVHNPLREHSLFCKIRKLN